MQRGLNWTEMSTQETSHSLFLAVLPLKDLHPPQVGVVLLSILCHIWKIVPDMYEAIINMKKMSQAAGEADSGCDGHVAAAAGDEARKKCSRLKRNVLKVV